MVFEVVQNHPLWVERKTELLLKKGNKCSVCSSSEYINVHHTAYQSGRAYWDYSDDYLLVVCHNCHSDIHNCTPMSRFYSFGNKLIHTDNWKDLNPLMSLLRKSMIHKGYSFDMILNLFSKKKKTLSLSDLNGIVYITGEDSNVIVSELQLRGVLVKCYPKNIVIKQNRQ